MNFLEERIMADGQVREGNILKVDTFLNHQLNIDVLDEIGKAFFDRFREKGITRVLTIEASGIAIATLTARYFKVPAVFAKKAKSRNLDGDLYVSNVHSFTYGRDYDVTLAKKFLSADDKVLLVDDFLAVGKAMQGLIDICNQADAMIAGIGIAIEKAFQEGGEKLRSAGYDLYSIAAIEEMTPDGGIRFRAQR